MAFLCEGCGRIRPTEVMASYRVTYRESGNQADGVHYCDGCAEMVNAGLAEHAVAAEFRSEAPKHTAFW